jgi:hypothetical protein
VTGPSPYQEADVLEDSVQLISVDDHVVEPAHVWTSRLPSAWQEAGPHIVEVGDEMLDWVYEGRHYPLTMQGSVNTRRFRERARVTSAATSAPTSAGSLAERLAQEGSEIVARHYDDMIPGCYDPVARVADMDLDGITASILFPSFGRFCGQTFFEAKDRELGLLCVQA